MSYTPGPWTFNYDDKPKIRSNTNPTTNIAIVQGKDDYSNARLIAAAPELVEALEDAIAVLELGEAESRSSIALDCRALLARIKGE